MPLNRNMPIRSPNPGAGGVYTPKVGWWDNGERSETTKPAEPDEDGGAEGE